MKGKKALAAVLSGGGFLPLWAHWDHEMQSISVRERHDAENVEHSYGGVEWIL